MADPPMLVPAADMLGANDSSGSTRGQLDGGPVGVQVAAENELRGSAKTFLSMFSSIAFVLPTKMRLRALDMAVWAREDGQQ